MAAKGKEKSKNGKYSQLYQMIDSDFIPVALEVYDAFSEKFEIFLKEDGENRFRRESCSLLFCLVELLKEEVFSYSSNSW